jgi:transcriptional regulator with XRE-family HTH domain
MDTPSRLKLKKKARSLRRRGLSYKEIREKIDVAKSTLSLWLKDVPLKPEHKARLYTKRILGMTRGAMGQKERRAREVDAIIKGAMDEISMPLSDDAYKLFGAALYWGEGNKTKNFGITNSDPYLIAFMVQWFEKVLNVKPVMLKPHLNIYPQQDELALKKFWSELTNIPLENFGKSFVKPLSNGYKKNNLYYGTMHIYVRKGTDFMHQVYGWRKAVLQPLENVVNLTERKWISLKETPRPVNLPKENNLPL